MRDLPALLPPFADGELGAETDGGLRPEPSAAGFRHFWIHVCFGRDETKPGQWAGVRGQSHHSQGWAPPLRSALENRGLGSGPSRIPPWETALVLWMGMDLLGVPLCLAAVPRFHCDLGDAGCQP